ncbi:MAG: hypothetical protein OZ921_10105 [Sorangiineae bacterium]|nr:hypothetical protein [Polyangiaceae bacterium]MEB2322858.1 hypothetical protein [Sorangiineae bacterium]
MRGAAPENFACAGNPEEVRKHFATGEMTLLSLRLVGFAHEADTSGSYLTTTSRNELGAR